MMSEIRDEYEWEEEIRDVILSETSNLTSEERVEFIQGTNAEFFLDAIYRLHFKENTTLKNIAKILGVSVHTIYRCFQKNEWTPKLSTVRKQIDEQTLRHLYNKERLSQKEIAEKLGVSLNTIYRRFKEYDVKARRIGTRDEVDIQEIRRLYYDKSYTQEEVAQRMNISEATVGRLFRDHGMRSIPRKREVKVSAEDVHHLYYEEGLTQQGVAGKLGVSSATIRQIFREQRWQYRKTGRRLEIDMNVVHRLYYDEGLSYEKVAKQLGVSITVISRIFNEQNWEPRKSIRWQEINPDDVYRLYFIDKLTQEEVAKRLGVSKPIIRRVFRQNAWQVRQRGFDNDIDRKKAAKERRKRTQIRVQKLRKELFGEECNICGQKRKLAIHRKDGSYHHKDALWRIRYLKSINSNEWVALCIPCHRGVHWMMKCGMMWAELVKLSDLINNQEGKELIPLKLPKPEHSSSLAYLQMRKDSNDSGELRRALFGESCHFCGVKNDEKRIVLHRKDGRAHPKKLISHLKYFRTLDPTEWVFLCQRHHRYVHWAMRRLNLKWQDLEQLWRNPYH